uniref:TERF2-interacting telomeric protein 1 n=1 Tax=Caenorhabditis tropicalis TaxID=1561998 RepID=A0A1I7V4V0_9PELO
MDKKDDSPKKSDSSSNVTSTAGEALQNCTESEWDASEEPYSAELLNVKKKPNRVNVFSATEKNLETVIVTEVSPPQTPLPKKPVVEHHNLARLIQKSCELLLEKTTADGTEVEIKLEFPDWRDSS